ncbi:V-type ATPase subunit family protein [Histomonas meleagridis]|uniref:V-type ATPase subunit family protein n=1 Tax=Histomonas meleagridis TaxID=135588 RepID=UPI00355AA604|nr:V-type ATPase subunit family protein [Histomonas meleagridis]KAH0798112.1 V-type ATPase subunit family protein [Histomonas meleagridis]
MTKESSVFFPEEMEYVELIVPHESAYFAIKRLSKGNIIHLIDENSKGINKRYTDDFMQCEDADRCLRYIQSQLEQYDLLSPPLTITEFEQLQQSNRVSNHDLLIEVVDAHRQLQNRIQNTQLLEAQYEHLNVTRDALRFYRPLLKEHNFDASVANDQTSVVEMELIGNNFLYSITGVIDATKMNKLFITMYRISRGNIIMTTSTEEDSTRGFFTVWFQSQILESKLSKVASSFGAEVFIFPTEESRIENQESELLNQLEDTVQVLRQSYSDNKSFLTELQGKFWFWKLFFTQECLIYTYLDYADFTSIEDRAIYHGWVPKRKISMLEPILDEATNEAGSAIRIDVRISQTTEPPPTWIETNKFTEPFQTLNDAYGYPEHNEVNGGAFYCMYPFLFGIMFGDVGHSLFFLLAGIALIYLYPKLKGTGEELFEQLLGFRYFIVIMAICGMYCGLLYNEFFGLPVDFFGSRYVPDETNSSTQTWHQKGKDIYPFGVDPIWLFKDNELVFLNSMKMKISIVLGITQMMFGMILQLIKQIKRKDWLKLWLHWLPQLVYLGSFFGYMVGIIIKKWCTPAEKQPQDGVNLIQVLISMLLSPTSLGTELKLYDGQLTVQNVIAILFVLTIPIMLFVTPIIEMCVHGVGNGIVETFVINLIDVIEFTLSALSHTASYLRLWALSLAHSQLAHVLYDELFLMTANMDMPIAPIIFFFGFAAWAVFSVVILLGMEAFSSLLHAIRLMWVEFSSKFYSGTGYEFTPLSFQKECEKIGIKYQ